MRKGKPVTEIVSNQQQHGDSPLHGLAARGVWRRSGPRRRLTPEQVARIRTAPDRAGAALAREFKISAVAAWRIRKYLTYRDLP
jgi:hypothetical protein